MTIVRAQRHLASDAAETVNSPLDTACPRSLHFKGGGFGTSNVAMTVEQNQPLEAENRLKSKVHDVVRRISWLLISSGLIRLQNPDMDRQSGRVWKWRMWSFLLEPDTNGAELDLNPEALNLSPRNRKMLVLVRLCPETWGTGGEAASGTIPERTWSSWTEGLGGRMVVQTGGKPVPVARLFVRFVSGGGTPQVWWTHAWFTRRQLCLSLEGSHESGMQVVVTTAPGDQFAQDAPTRTNRQEKGRI